MCVVGILTKTESLNLLGVEMNALELADELDDMLKAIGLTDNRVPTMLRQQQAEIEALKGGFFDWSGFKELTDEEIEKIVKDNNFYWDEYGGFVDSKELLKVARAILRKAQEK